MSLRYPIALFLFVPIVVLLIAHFRNPSGRKTLSFPLYLRNIRSGFTGRWQNISFFLVRLVAFALLVYCVARPQTSSTQVRRTSEGIDIMIALDVSASMLIEDEKGFSRISIAKETVKKFISGRSDDRIGFLMFSGEAITLCPPTLDYQVLQESVDMADINQMKDGTAIGDALATAVNRLKDSKAKTRVIILLTDGDNNMGSIAPLSAGDLAFGYGIKVYSIALGKEGMVNMPQEGNFFGKKYKTYAQVESTINPELIQKIAETTGGKFFRVEEQDSLRRVFSEINKLERSKVETKERVQWNEEYQPYLILALSLLLLEQILSRTIFRILPG